MLESKISQPEMDSMHLSPYKGFQDLETYMYLECEGVGSFFSLAQI